MRTIRFHFSLIMRAGLFALVLFSCFICSNVNAQTYHPFPDSSARWSEENYYLGALPGVSYNNYHGWAYTLGNDTSINSLHYTLIGYQMTYYYRFVGVDPDEATNFPVSVTGQICGAIREDSSRKVWFRNLFACDTPYFSGYGPWYLPLDSEFLLYDFNLAAGDYVHVGAYVKQVIAIDSIELLDGSFRKRYKLYVPNSNHVEEYWIEGIGSTLGLFNSLTAFPSGGFPPYYCWLNCFRKDGQYLFKKSPFPLHIICDATLLAPIGINDPVRSTHSLCLRPNPFNSQTTIGFGLDKSSAISLQIFSITGQLVKTLLNNENFAGGFHEINFDPEGMEQAFTFSG